MNKETGIEQVQEDQTPFKLSNYPFCFFIDNQLFANNYGKVKTETSASAR